MTTAITPALLTTEELLALPENGTDRWLIAGHLREKPMTVRNRYHSRVMARITQLLGMWLDQQPPQRGEILCGEAGCRLRRNPDTTVGMDVVYVGPEVAVLEAEDTTLIDGVPILAVEILSPNDVLEEIEEKVEGYLTAGVRQVWLIQPRFRTVVVHRPDEEPVMFNVRQELSGDPDLPGFRIPVLSIFER